MKLKVAETANRRTVKSEPKNRRTAEYRMSKDCIAALCPFLVNENRLIDLQDQRTSVDGWNRCARSFYKIEGPPLKL